MRLSATSARKQPLVSPASPDCITVSIARDKGRDDIDRQHLRHSQGKTVGNVLTELAGGA